MIERDACATGGESIDTELSRAVEKVLHVLMSFLLILIV